MTPLFPFRPNEMTGGVQSAQVYKSRKNLAKKKSKGRT
jgi:hypothetical protein